MNDSQLKLGLLGLARAGDTTWFNGHFGATVLAGQDLLKRSDFSAQVKLGIKDQISRALQIKPELFIPFENDTPATNAEENILAAVKKNTKALSISGHGIIYGALALNALKQLNGEMTQKTLEGIIKLLTLTLTDRKTRYYNISDYSHVRVTQEDAIPEYDSVETMVVTSLKECSVLYKDMQVGPDFYFFTAEKLHALTFAHAISLLWKLGHVQTAKDAFPIHRKMVKLNRMVPPKELAVPVKATKGLHPYLPEYWAKDHFDDHAIKLAIAVIELLEDLPKEKIATLYKKEEFWEPFMR